MKTVPTFNITKVEYILQTNLLEDGGSHNITNWSRSENMDEILKEFDLKLDWYKEHMGEPDAVFGHLAKWSHNNKEFFLMVSEEWTREQA